MHFPKSFLTPFFRQNPVDLWMVSTLICWGSHLTVAITRDDETTEATSHGFRRASIPLSAKRARATKAMQSQWWRITTHVHMQNVGTSFFLERCDYNVRHPEQWWMIWRWLPSSFQKKRCGIPAPAFATDNKKKGLARRLPDIAWYVVSLFLHASAARCREHPEETDVSGFPLFFSFCFRLDFRCNKYWYIFD